MLVACGGGSHASQAVVDDSGLDTYFRLQFDFAHPTGKLFLERIADVMTAEEEAALMADDDDEDGEDGAGGEASLNVSVEQAELAAGAELDAAAAERAGGDGKLADIAAQGVAAAEEVAQRQLKADHTKHTAEHNAGEAQAAAAGSGDAVEEEQDGTEQEISEADKAAAIEKAAAAVAAFEASKIAAAAPRAEFFGFRSRELLEEVVAAINEARGDDWVQD